MPPIPMYDKPTLAGVPLIPLGDGRYGPPPMRGAAIDDDLGDKLKQIERDLNELRDERKTAVEDRESAKRAFAAVDGYDTNSREYKAAQQAVKRVGEIDDKIANVQAAQVATLKLLGRDGTTATSQPDGSARWDAGALLAEQRVKSELEQMASSKMQVGRALLGQIAPREVFKNGDVMKADVAATPEMRQATYAGIVPQLRRRLRILDLLPTGTTDGNSVPYTQESGSLSTAAETAEGAAKPEAAAIYTDANAPVATIAHWLKNRKQALADLAALQSILEGRLRYGVQRRLEDEILAGNGVGENIRGILNTTGIGTVAFTAGALVADQVLNGITTVFLSDAEANAVAMHPTDWKAALQAKASGDGHYFSGGPFQVTAQQMWGVPLVPSRAIPQGTALVGDFAVGAQLFVREGVSVLVSDADQDDFIKNRVTILAEMRAALAVWMPAAFATVALQ